MFFNLDSIQSYSCTKADSRKLQKIDKMKKLFTVIIFLSFLSCKKENDKNPFLSKELKKNLDSVFGGSDSHVKIKTIQVTFSKFNENCYVYFQGYGKSIKCNNSFNYKGKILLFSDNSECAQNFVEPIFLKKKSIDTIVMKNEKLDLSKTILPIFDVAYRIDKSGKLIYIPKL
jgi:hypothetical protein